MAPHTTTREKEIYKVTIIGSIVNFALLVFKFIAGIVGHQSAQLQYTRHRHRDLWQQYLFHNLLQEPKALFYEGNVTLCIY